ncbi:NOT5 [[Candida] subhashii]|uniref:General negative regulator of transcription subunit n=1 Tax=[Candida] subhashii TaxID=561895 RepID=A0A8J5UII1_9ASCO|nr:NOT5 [[Candida] subhashii]KAG7663648.1 NOT5 [[Candida] subhashii]
MSARKLQQEFDKTNKKIAEGLSVFDDIYLKLTTTDISSQKEKLESDLKKEIKKLQRSREQLKTWLGDTSIKLDKNLLQENRTKIEHAMDQFKDLEKSSKIKQFSNEGLELQSQRTRFSRFGDGDDAKRNESMQYISDVIEQLNQQNETLEEELESLGGQSKRGKGGSYSVQSSIEDVKYKIDRNNTHVERLEEILDRLDTDRLDPSKIDDIKDDLDYYVENNQDEDYVEYDEFYDQLEMEDDDVEIQGSLAQMAAETAEEESKEEAAVAAAAAAAAAAASVPPPAKPEVKHTPPKPTPAGINASTSSTPNKKKPSIVPAPAPPPITGYSSAIKAAQQSSKSASSTPKNAPATIATASSSTSSTPAKMPPPGLNQQSQAPKSQSVSPLISKEKLQEDGNDQVSASQSPITSSSKIFKDGISRINSIVQSRLSNPLPFQEINSLLESSLLNCPDSFDAEKPRQYIPVNIHPSSMDYPQEPMYELNSANYMKKFDNDTLFFCFYYSQGVDNIARWNAAQELSKRGWIFNTEFKQWFLKDNKSGSKNRSMSVVQREEEQDSVDGRNNEVEEANYKYFDYEKTWLTRRRENYKFSQELRQTF